MKIGIIGAGISGLSLGKLLNSLHDVQIFEKSSSVGGIARVKMHGEIPYHLVGGHCLNSKNLQVMDFVDQILPKENWHSVTRVAKISFRNHLINYPIEFSMRQIADFDEDLAFNMTKDFLSATDENPDTLDKWFRAKFGDTLANEYFIPYNTKIWGMSPSDMSAKWVEGKLPLPNKMQFFKGLVSSERDTMPHSQFFYPNNNSQNQFIDALASGLKIS
jgi:protoporphyrinogen oxidase